MDLGGALDFVKMHGAGNDYLMLDTRGVAGGVDAFVGSAGWGGFVRGVCGRRTGVGADGVFVLGDGDGGVVASARVFNSDGGEGDMCGNGLRCAAALLAAREGLGVGEELAIAAGGRRVVAVIGGGGSVGVSMGRAVFDPEAVPVSSGRLRRVRGRGGVAAFVVAGLEMVFVNVGNPHGVVFTERDVESFDLAVRGPELESHPAFPKRMNVHVARVLDRESVRVRNFERGAGETAACGSGACAVVAAGALAGRLADEAAVLMDGGELRVRWDRSRNELWLSGPVAFVAEVRVRVGEFV